MGRYMGQILIFLCILFLLDLYVFQAVRTVTSGIKPLYRQMVFAAYWLVTIVTFLVIVSAPYLRDNIPSRALRIYPFAILIGIFLAKLFAVVFFMVDDLRRLAMWVFNQFQQSANSTAASSAAVDTISRSTFLSWLGIGVGGTLFGTLLYGFKNQYNYQVRRFVLSFPNLPNSFRGLKIAHISDIHSGSFMDKEAVLRGVNTINEQKPDIILFTGDLVNDRASEMEPFKEIFSKLEAPLGVYSILGNHDYGDYVKWESREEKERNLAQLKAIHAEMGWRLLLDESVILEKDGQTIGLIGVQNISGKARFHSYGNLEKAYQDSASTSFKILMSHDPSHWDAEVRTKYPEIDLTLSGHTHGMQFGVELPWFRWSPVQWVYRQWAGLYEEGQQKLYVNRGFGFIGYPGRVGILPEITFLDLV